MRTADEWDAGGHDAGGGSATRVAATTAPAVGSRPWLQQQTARLRQWRRTLLAAEESGTRPRHRIKFAAHGGQLVQLLAAGRKQAAPHDFAGQRATGPAPVAETAIPFQRLELENQVHNGVGRPCQLTARPARIKQVNYSLRPPVLEAAG